MERNEYKQQKQKVKDNCEMKDEFGWKPKQKEEYGQHNKNRKKKYHRIQGKGRAKNRKQKSDKR